MTSTFTRRATLLAAAGLAASRFGVGRAAAAGPDLAAAKHEAQVMLYTSLDTKIADAIIKPFREKYGINVSYYRGGSADVTSKLLAEADAGRVQADVADASDVGGFLVMKQHGLLRPYQSAEAASIAANLRDPDGTWVADRLTQAVIQWNTAKVGGDPPRHWKDLADARFKGQLAYFSSSNGDGAPRLYTLANAFGWGLLKQYAALKPLRVTTPQMVAQVIENGERAAAFCTNDNIAWRSKRGGKPTDYGFPTEGVPTELGAVALLKAAPHPNAGMLFYDWWIGRTGQQILVDGGKYSSRADMPPPTGNPPLKELKLLVPDPARLFADRSEMISKLTDIFGGEWGE